MATFGCPRIFITIRQKLHNSMLAKFQDNRQTLKLFSVSSRVKQGCIFTSTLFILLFSAIVIDVFKVENSDTDTAIGIKDHTDGSVYCVRRL
uniref:Reverse transcriptase domain-containing protein n=1 Tax=Octopus bimaculoides TaxID=37653 RepID=A0A0L8IB14_OCTBM